MNEFGTIYFGIKPGSHGICYQLYSPSVLEADSVRVARSYNNRYIRAVLLINQPVWTRPLSLVFSWFPVCYFIFWYPQKVASTVTGYPFYVGGLVLKAFFRPEVLYGFYSGSAVQCQSTLFTRFFCQSKNYHFYVEGGADLGALRFHPLDRFYLFPAFVHHHHHHPFMPLFFGVPSECIVSSAGSRSVRGCFIACLSVQLSAIERLNGCFTALFVRLSTYLRYLLAFFLVFSMTAPF